MATEYGVNVLRMGVSFQKVIIRERPYYACSIIGSVKVKNDVFRLGSLGVVVCLRGFCGFTPLSRNKSS